MNNLNIIKSANYSCPIYYVERSQFDTWLASRSTAERTWVQQNKFQAKPSQFITLPDKSGQIAGVVFIAPEHVEFSSCAGLAEKLPEQTYHLDSSWPENAQYFAILAWCLGCYQFTQYKLPNKKFPLLVVNHDFDTIAAIGKAIYLTRDLINTPCEDMGPSHLYEVAEKLSYEFGCAVSQIVGYELINHNFPMIYAVGRAGAREPRLIELNWGNQTHTAITLIGKGVCFDTGGLDIKPAQYMQIMKKDMGGAAHVLGLAQLIMETKLPVRLKVLIPAVENNISYNAYRPGDILNSRKGSTVEIGNTDAEGRLILADALTYACEDKPDLIIDFATLTGAARIAMGTDLPAMFSNNDYLAQSLQKLSMDWSDPVWHMPLWQPYRKMLDSPIADLNNVSSSSQGGAISAALFLEHFMKRDISWIHIDLMAWNNTTNPGKPLGGEAMGLRSIYELIKKQCS